MLYKTSSFCDRIFVGRFRRTVYDAQQLNAAAGTTADGFLLENKTILRDFEDNYLLKKSKYYVQHMVL